MQTLVLDPPTIYPLVDKIAVQKASATWSRTLMLGFIAGAFIAVGTQTFVNITAGTGVTPPTVVLGAVFFATGLFCIVTLGAELFTGACMMLMALFEGHVSIGGLLLQWFMAYVGNFLGCFFFAVLNHGAGTNSYPQDTFTSAGTRLCTVTMAKANEPPHQMFFRGILCNFCVCCAVLLSIASKSTTGKAYAVVFPLVCFIVCGYDHSIANMYFFTMGTIANCNKGDHGFFWANLVLSTAGNILGAVILAIVYWFCFLHGAAIPGSPRVYKQEAGADSNAPNHNAA